MAVLPAAVMLPYCQLTGTIPSQTPLAAHEEGDRRCPVLLRIDEPYWFHWGFQWYIESSGALPLGPRLARFPISENLLPTDRTSPLLKLRSGDLLVVPENNTNVRVNISRSRTVPLVVRLGRSGAEIPDLRNSIHRIPVSIIHHTFRILRCGFYSDTFGPLPFTAGPMRP
ncbi:MAG: hypothetical protein R3C02_24060 [Planctomycetaceae bacterium]